MRSEKGFLSLYAGIAVVGFLILAFTFGIFTQDRAQENTADATPKKESATQPEFAATTTGGEVKAPEGEPKQSPPPKKAAANSGLRPHG